MLYLILILQLVFFPSLVRAQNSAPAQPRLDTTTFVVLGEGLAAGMANTGMSSPVQDKSFPAQMARQMGTAFPQPLMQSPGAGDMLGVPPLPVRVPTYPEGTLRIFPQQPNPNDNAPTLFVLNLSVPNFTLSDSLTRRPLSPLVHDDDSKQTNINLILGFPAMILGKSEIKLWSQYEYAIAMNPTLALVELGYWEVLQAAAAADPALIPDAASFRASYSTLVKGLRGTQAQVLVTTIPDPIDTAYFSSATEAAALLGVPAATILSGNGLAPGDLITRNGLTAIGYQLMGKGKAPLPPGSVVSASVTAAISSRVQALNAAITSVASENGAVVYDLQAFIRRIKTSGATAGSIPIRANYLGGFYSLDGVYPGAAGHALIANDILGFLNRTYGASFPLLDVPSIAAADAATQSRPAAAQ